MASYFLPMSTYGTILDLRETHEGSLTLAVLGSLSEFYVDHAGIDSMPRGCTV